MSGFITAGSEFNGQENQDIFLRPIFTGEDIERMGIRTLLSVKSSLKVTFFDAQTKITKAYAAGFQGGTAATQRQKKFILAEFKAENDYDKHDYSDTILEEITNRGGISQNDISGTDVHNAEVQVFGNAVRSDVFRIFWLGDIAKKTVTSGLKDDGTPDVDYNVIDGIWTEIIASASTTASAQPNGANILRIAVNNNVGSAQGETQTLASITAGTIIVTINSVAYSEVFATSATVTVTNFVATHAATLAALDVTITDGGTGALVIVSAVAGQPYVLVATDAGTNGTWTQSAVTANTAPADLGTDEAIGYFKSMLINAPKVLKDKAIRSAIRLYVTDSMEENYQNTLEDDGTEQAHTKIITGVERFTWRGIPLLPMEIDQHLANDFISPFPHRAILTLPQNLVLVLNGASQIGETRFWFNPDENKNRQRTQFEFGADFVLPEFMVVAY